MVDERAPDADRLPTLTEVVDLAAAQEAAGPVEVEAPMPEALAPLRPQPSPGAAVDAALVAQLLAAAAPRIDAAVQCWLDAVLEPALRRTFDTLLLDARQTLPAALQAALAEAVAAGDVAPPPEPGVRGPEPVQAAPPADG